MNDLAVYFENADKFWAKVVEVENGCRLWTGPILDSGYGLFSFPRGAFGGASNGKSRPQKSVRAHRVAYILANGKFPAVGMYICHRCDNPPCVNPDHLWEGTSMDNYVDMRIKGRKTGVQKLSIEEVRRIYEGGEPVSKLSLELGIGKSAIWKIRSGGAWSGLTKDMRRHES